MMVASIVFASIEVGQFLPDLALPPINRTTLALYAGASGDHNPNHIDIDAARAAGMDDVFAHGMLPMAFLGRLLTGWAPQRQIQHFEARFVSITHVGDCITCRGEVVQKIEDHEGKRLVLTLYARDQQGDIKLTGSATMVFD